MEDCIGCALHTQEQHLYRCDVNTPRTPGHRPCFKFQLNGLQQYDLMIKTDLWPDCVVHASRVFRSNSVRILCRFSKQECSGVGCCAHLQGIFNQGSNLLYISCIASRFFNTNANWEATCLPFIRCKDSGITYLLWIAKAGWSSFRPTVSVSLLCNQQNYGSSKKRKICLRLCLWYSWLQKQLSFCRKIHFCLC